MLFEDTAIPGVFVMEPRRFQDERGYFSELFRLDLFQAKAGREIVFVQDNQSLSRPRGTVRGLHYQIGEAAQGKLVRCQRGAILDVAVDIRVGSPTYGRHVAVELSAEDGRWLWIPVGFAHGFCTLEPDTEVLYKVTAYYSAAQDRGIRWNDPALGIVWPVDETTAVLSPKDRVQPLLSEAEAAFHV